MSNEINIEELERLANELIGSVPGTALYRDLSIVFTVTMSPDGVLPLIDRLKKAEAERDALAAKLAELEEQEPIGEVTHSDVLPNAEEKYRHEFVSDFRIGVQAELYVRPVPAEPVNVDFGMRGENMFFQIGNQSFLLDYKPEEHGEFEFMKGMLLSAFSRITHGVKTESQPVNARILGAIKRLSFCAQTTGGTAGRDEELCAAIGEAEKAIAAAEAAPKDSLPNQRLLAAARAVVARWETPLWKDAGATAGFIHELRDALAEAASKAVRLEKSEAEDLAWAANQEALSFGVSLEPFTRLVRTVESAVLRKNGIEVAE